MRVDATRALASLPERVARDATSRLNRVSTLPGVERIVIFGSRAKGTHRDDSDLDVAVFFLNDSTDLLECYRQLVHLCVSPDLDIQVQAFCVSELDAPCGVVEEIVKYGEVFFPR